MPNTTNFNWNTPADTDLVKDGAAAIRTLGNNIDASLVDLKGGTTGQVLAKASNADLDYTWSNVDPLTILDAKGDLISATAADTPARLAVGANGTVLTADSSTATGLRWGTVSSPIKQIVTATRTSNTTNTGTSYVDSGLAATITPTSASSSIIILVSIPGAYVFRNTTTDTGGAGLVRIRRNSSNVLNAGAFGGTAIYNATSASKQFISAFSMNHIDSPATTSATSYQVQIAADTNWTIDPQFSSSQPGSIILLEI